MTTYTKHLPDLGPEVTPTVAYRVPPDELTEEEHAAVKSGEFGYCERHRFLYRVWAVHNCILPAIFPDKYPRTECKEWVRGTNDRKETV